MSETIYLGNGGKKTSSPATRVWNSVYKNFRIIQIWALKRKYDSEPKMRKFQSRRCKKTRGRRKRRERSDRISWLGVMIE